jgi:hypothetical protein
MINGCHDHCFITFLVVLTAVGAISFAFVSPIVSLFAMIVDLFILILPRVRSSSQRLTIKQRKKSITRRSTKNETNPTATKADPKTKDLIIESQAKTQSKLQYHNCHDQHC